MPALEDEHLPPPPGGTGHGHRIGHRRVLIGGARNQQPWAPNAGGILRVGSRLGGQAHHLLPALQLVCHQPLRAGHVAFRHEKVATSRSRHFAPHYGAHRKGNDTGPAAWETVPRISQRRAQVHRKLVIIKALLVNGKIRTVPKAAVIE